MAIKRACNLSLANKGPHPSFCSNHREVWLSAQSTYGGRQKGKPGAAGGQPAATYGERPRNEDNTKESQVEKERDRDRQTGAKRDRDSGERERRD